MNVNSVVRVAVLFELEQLVDHDVIVEEYVHVNTGAICKAGSHIEALRK